MDFDPAVFGAIDRVAVFSAQGDVEGIATVAGVGQLPDLPAWAVTVAVLPGAVAGAVSPITLDASQATWADASQRKYSEPSSPGSVTVGDQLSVRSVTPGGGLLAAGASGADRRDWLQCQPNGERCRSERERYAIRWAGRGQT
jgi:hypothetical protein